MSIIVIRLTVLDNAEETIIEVTQNLPHTSCSRDWLINKPFLFSFWPLLPIYPIFSSAYLSLNDFFEWTYYFISIEVACGNSPLESRDAGMTMQTNGLNACGLPGWEEQLLKLNLSITAHELFRFQSLVTSSDQETRKSSLKTVKLKFAFKWGKKKTKLNSTSFCYLFIYWTRNIF